MYGYTFRRSLPRLTNYQEAVAHEAKVVPMRGGTIKPLGSRRHKYIGIRKVGEDIVVSIGSTDFLKFHPDDTISLHYNFRWGAASTNEITSIVLGVAIFTKDHRIWARCGVGGVWGNYLIPIGRNADNAPSKFKILQTDGVKVPVYLNPVYPVTHVRDRKKSNAVYKEYSAFRKYLYGLIKLRGETSFRCGVNNWRSASSATPDTQFKHEEYTEMFGEGYHYTRFAHGDCDHIRDAITSDDPEKMLRSAMWLLYGKAFTVARAKEQLDKAIDRGHKDELFSEVVHKDGKVVKDRYGWLF